MIETAEQWDDEWWRYFEDSRGAGNHGEVAARHADVEMSERHGLRPHEPAMTVVISAQPYSTDPLAESVLRLARGAKLQLEPWQVDLIKRFYGYIGGRRNGRATARALIGEIHTVARTSPPVIVDELDHFVASGPPRRGWFRRMLGLR